MGAAGFEDGVVSFVEGLGIEVEARSAGDALACFDEHKGEIDLLLTDVVMPGGMTGQRLADELLARAPRLAVLLTSGYGGEVGHTEAGRALPLLPKPFAPGRLLAAVRSALDAAAEAAEP